MEEDRKVQVILEGKVTILDIGKVDVTNLVLC